MPARKSFLFEREGVSAADDLTAPHRKSLKFDGTIGSLLSAVESELPYRIHGGLASWLIRVNEEPIAVIALQWEGPKLLRDHCMIKQCLAMRKPSVFAEYHGSEPPEELVGRFAPK